MKGLLYCDFLLNRKWFLGAGIIIVLGTVISLILYYSLWNGNIIMPFACGAAQAIAAFVCTEWPGRSLEANLKCRFTDYLLTSAISKRTFVLTELLKNIISMMISLAMCVVMQLVLSVLDKHVFNFLNLCIYILILGTLKWITSLVTVYLRSAEKAGLIVAIGFVLFVVFPYIYVNTSINKIGTLGYSIWYFTEYLEWHGYGWILTLIFYGIIMGAYVITYELFLRRIRKGDVCK